MWKLPFSQRSANSHPSLRPLTIQSNHSSPLTARWFLLYWDWISDHDILALLRQPRKILRTIPHLSRVTVARKLAGMVEQVVSRNDVSSCVRLLSFPKKCLGTPWRGKRWSLATLVNKQVTQVSSEAKTPASSEDVITEYSIETLEALKSKHLPHTLRLQLSCLEAHPFTPILDRSWGHRAGNLILLQWFRGDPDGLLPQHLKDLISSSAGDGGTSLILEGRTPPAIWPLFFGVKLTALTKKCGGVRPITVSCSLRRLASKYSCLHAIQTIPSCWPSSTGLRYPCRVEAAVHAGWVYLSTFHLTTPWLKWISEKPSTASKETGFWELLKNTSLVCYNSYIHHTSLPRSSCGMIPKYCQWKAFSKATPWVPCCFAWVSTSSYPLCSLNSMPSTLMMAQSEGKSKTSSWPTTDWGPRESLRAIPKCRLVRTDISQQFHCKQQLDAFPGQQIVHPTHARLLGFPLGNEGLQCCLEEQHNQVKLTCRCSSRSPTYAWWHHHLMPLTLHFQAFAHRFQDYQHQLQLQAGGRI